MKNSDPTITLRFSDGEVVRMEIVGGVQADHVKIAIACLVDALGAHGDLEEYIKELSSGKVPSISRVTQ